LTLTTLFFDDMKKQYRKLTGEGEKTLKELGIPKAKIQRVDELAYINKLKRWPEIKVHLDQGVVQRHRYKDLVEEGVLEANDRDPSKNRLMPFSCWSCLRCCLSPVDEAEMVFLSNCTFIFSTTDTDGLFQLSLSYTSKSGTALLVMQNVALRDLIPEDEDEEPDDSAVVMKYDPTGDNVAVRNRQTFRFNRKELAERLKRLPTPVRKFTVDSPAAV